MRARRANPAADFVVAPVAGGEENLASAGSESHAHFSVEQGTVCTVRLVAEVIFQKVYAVFGKGLGVEIFMVKAARIVGAGACSGAGIHAELEPLAVDIVADCFHPVGELLLVGDYLSRLRVALSLAPAVVDDKILISAVTQTELDHLVGGFFDKLFVDVFAECVPGVETHRRSF